MLPCLNKQLFGIDCVGCGFQRAFIHVVKGNFTAAFNIYPAIYTLLLFAIFLLLNLKFKFKNSRKIIITFAIINVLIILISYFIKMKHLFTL
ncbi:DUF2752 domain-containing protein [Polaribacter ponticola]|uniref:DUF2752 domain-containing protein n=1 Tax=Polaribacter ponticola TaxID=2978475 RepID=A0ABT5SCY6_9FLAO|nr:DUF2752 domain-containing protein [Polaribacter sp. MSW5]MDD7915986.1 DUF2752 domain-containing protein [Polaribacter sp. MSW5]